MIAPIEPNPELSCPATYSNSFAEIAETNTAAVDKHSPNRRSSSKSSRKSFPVDEREGGETTVRGPPSVRVRRDRISPESPPKMFKKGASDGEKKSKRRSSSKTSKLAVETKLDNDGDSNDTPRTESSTPASTTIPTSLRGSTDLRSPGQRKSPSAKVANDEETPIPDFITQTDKYGNAVTPRSSTAIVKARIEHPTGAKPHLHVGSDGKLREDDVVPVNNVDACAETLLDSIRIMCCCLLPDEPQTAPQTRSLPVSPVNKVEEIVEAKPQLLPKLHPDDHGKKCLVLDLDETLVHSSFRAVPGADFVIPVQVRTVSVMRDVRILCAFVDLL